MGNSTEQCSICLFIIIKLYARENSLNYYIRIRSYANTSNQINNQRQKLKEQYKPGDRKINNCWEIPSSESRLGM